MVEGELPSRSWRPSAGRARARRQVISAARFRPQSKDLRQAGLLTLAWLALWLALSWASGGAGATLVKGGARVGRRALAGDQQQQQPVSVPYKTCKFGRPNY